LGQGGGETTAGAGPAPVEPFAGLSILRTLDRLQGDSAIEPTTETGIKERLW
jgi:hypothetical protein